MEDGRCRRAARALVLATAFFATGLCFCLPGPTLVELVNQTHSNYSRLSYLFAARSSGELLGSMVGEQLLGYRSGEVVLSGSLVLAAAGAVAVPWCRGLPLLILAFTATGVALGAASRAGTKLADEATLHKLRLLSVLGACVCPVLIIVIIQLGGQPRIVYMTSAASLTIASLLPFWFRRKQHLEQLAETETAAPQPQRVEPKPSHEYVIRALGLAVLFLTSGTHLATGQLLGAFSATFSDTGTVDSKLVTSLFYGSSLVVSAMAGVLRASSFWPLVVAQSGAVLGAILLTSLPGLWVVHFVAAGLLGSSLSCALAFETPTDAIRRIPTLRTTTQHVGEMLVCLVLGATLDDQDARAFGIRTCVVVALALTLLLVLWSTTARRRRAALAPLPTVEVRNDQREVEAAASAASRGRTTTWYVQETDPSINRNAATSESPACVPADGVRQQ